MELNKLYNYISIKEKLPENKNNRYLCYDDNHGYEQVFEWFYNFVKKQWEWWGIDEYDFIVTHWMPLPPPPEYKL